MTKSKRVVTHGNGHKFSNEKFTHVQGPYCPPPPYKLPKSAKKKLGFVPLTCLCLLDELPQLWKMKDTPLH